MEDIGKLDSDCVAAITDNVEEIKQICNYSQDVNVTD